MDCPNPSIIPKSGAFNVTQQVSHYEIIIVLKLNANKLGSKTNTINLIILMKAEKCKELTCYTRLTIYDKQTYEILNGIFG